MCLLVRFFVYNWLQRDEASLWNFIFVCYLLYMYSFLFLHLHIYVVIYLWLETEEMYPLSET